MWNVRGGKPDPTMACNGMLAGLVAITAPCAFVNSICAASSASSPVSSLSIRAPFESVLKIDDPVGAISVHGANGAWGVISLGLFADGTYGDGWNGVSGTVKGLFFGGGASQLIAELVGLLACTVYLGIVGGICSP